MQRTRTYECMCLLDNREVRKGWQPLKDAVLGLFTKHGAKILSGKRWDERRLAYPIRGQHRGTYMLVYLSAGTQSLTAIRRDLQFNESLLRFLLVECEAVPETAYEPEAEFDVNTIPADDAPAQPAPEPEAVEVSSSGDAGAAEAGKETEATSTETEASKES